MLDVPTKHDLRGGLAVRARDLEDDGVRERVLDRAWIIGPVDVDASERRPRLRRDTEARMYIAQSALGEEWVELDLVYGRAR